MYSLCDTLKGGFPHSEISGSKLICQLPEAYRRLSRPSSLIIAKASTTCSYSLDPITLTSLTRVLGSSRNCEVSHLARYAVLQTNRSVEVHLTQSKIHVARGTVLVRFGLRPKPQSFPRATLIRLYELLKNSRSIEQCRSTTKQPLAKPLWC